jgi:dTDP-4-dehydrorhamnose 3,5-epimerase-like enzyme
MAEKVRIDELPITAEFLREKRLLQERGELALIADGQPFKHLGYFSLRPGDGHFRGSHYHKVKTEHFYVISGELDISLVDLDTNEKTTIRLRSGHRVEIGPMCAHRFRAVEHAQVIEYYDALYDPEDDHPHHDFA